MRLPVPGHCLARPLAGTPKYLSILTFPARPRFIANAIGLPGELVAYGDGRVVVHQAREGDREEG